MKSLFFNAGENRCVLTRLPAPSGASLLRMDVSNGLVFLEIRVEKGAVLPKRVRECWDRMLVLPLLMRGELHIAEKGGEPLRFKEGNGALLLAGPGNFHLGEIRGEAHLFVLFVADFFLARYRQGDSEDPIDRLYGLLEGTKGLSEIAHHPMDAYGDYLLERILLSSRRKTMSRLATEHRIVELFLHRLDLLSLEGDHAILGEEERRITDEARAILIRDYADPPTIPELARLCRTNDFRLKRAFKKRYDRTIHNYVKALRLEAANRLLREGDLSVGEVAARVGYRHKGHFSRLFYQRYGIYPASIVSKKSLL